MLYAFVIVDIAEYTLCVLVICCLICSVHLLLYVWGVLVNIYAARQALCICFLCMHCSICSMSQCHYDMLYVFAMACVA